MKAVDTLRSARPTAPLDVEAVIAELAPRVRQWVHRYLGPSADADDCAQEALIEIVAALDRYEGRAQLTTYTRRIALRVAGRWAKRARAGQTPGLRLLPVDTRDPESIAMGREGLRSLYACLGHLSEKRRVAFVLSDIEKMSHAEAAEVCGVDLETFRARLKRARKQLRELAQRDAYLAPLFEGAP